MVIVEDDPLQSSAPSDQQVVTDAEGNIELQHDALPHQNSNDLQDVTNTQAVSSDMSHPTATQGSAPPDRPSTPLQEQLSIDELVAIGVDHCKAAGLDHNPVEALRYFQSLLVYGRP